ncbi:tRNA-specific adenosine deaminase 1 [Monosporozyma servazzii]
MTQYELANSITEQVYIEYDKLKPTGKPRDKSNGIKECTVLAAIVAIDKHHANNTFDIITITTGVKATPDSDLARSSGKMLHDCHAEILAIRGFNAILLDEMIHLKKGDTSKYLMSSGDKFRWNDKWSLALFISRLPCGDASMDSIDSSTDEDKLINMSDDDPYQYILPDHKETLRGRFNFKKKGYVRTKPGRQDSKITLSKSCSDKICIRQVISINNAFTYNMMKEPIYLDYMIIPNVDSKSRSSLKRCFEDRIKDCPYPVHTFQILSSDKPFQDDIVKGKEPSPLSVIKVFYRSNNSTLEQVVLNGVKNGSYTKGKKPLRKNCEPILSRYALWKKYLQLISQNTLVYDKITTYEKFKRDFNRDRNEMIISVKKMLVKGEDWISTYKDDFGLD